MAITKANPGPIADAEQIADFDEAVLETAAVEETYTCQSTDVIGDWVYIKGTGATVEVEECDPNDVTKMPAIGMITSKPTSTTAVVKLGGTLTGVIGLSPGESYFADIPSGSQMTPTNPPTPGVGEYVIAQQVGVALSTTAFRITGAMVMYRIDGPSS
jgi:hypothetical protein